MGTGAGTAGPSVGGTPGMDPSGHTRSRAIPRMSLCKGSPGAGAEGPAGRSELGAGIGPGLDREAPVGALVSPTMGQVGPAAPRAEGRTAGMGPASPGAPRRRTGPSGSRTPCRNCQWPEGGCRTLDRASKGNDGRAINHLRLFVYGMSIVDRTVPLLKAFALRRGSRAPIPPRTQGMPIRLGGLQRP